MAKLKTQPTRKSVSAFLKQLPDPGTRADCKALVRMMREATGSVPQMWGESIVGFGKYHFTYASGREGDWFLIGFSPRKLNLTLYIMAGFDGYDDLLDSLGRFSTGKSCLYIKSLQDVHQPTLRRLIQKSVRHVRRSNR